MVTVCPNDMIILTDTLVWSCVTSRISKRSDVGSTAGVPSSASVGDVTGRGTHGGSLDPKC